MAITKTNFVRGNNLADIDFNFDDAANLIYVKTAAGSSVGDAIAAAVAALPVDVYVNGLSSYDAATNTLTLSMSDGSTVALDMTSLVADAVASVGAASETASGIAEIATQAEVNAGTDDLRFVTPLKLATYVGNAIAAAATPAASETVAGKIEIATNAEALAGTSTTLAITPATLAAAIAAQLDVFNL